MVVIVADDLGFLGPGFPTWALSDPLSGPLRLRVQSRVEDAVENRGLYRVVVSCLFLRGL